jgi:thermostable 8-oxoguanine DNA glycosylase
LGLIAATLIKNCYNLSLLRNFDLSGVFKSQTLNFQTWEMKMISKLLGYNPLVRFGNQGSAVAKFLPATKAKAESIVLDHGRFVLPAEFVEAAVTNFHRTEAELQAFWLFSLLTANFKATHAHRSLVKLLSDVPGEMPFDRIKTIIAQGQLENRVRNSGHRFPTKTIRSLQDTIALYDRGQLNLRTATVEDLKKIHGCAEKTSRFFILHSRANQQLAVLDVHILNWLRHLGFSKVPQLTPTGRLYRHFETIFLKIAERLDMSVSDLDFSIWQAGSHASQHLEISPDAKTKALLKFSLNKSEIQALEQLANAVTGHPA